MLQNIKKNKTRSLYFPKRLNEAMNGIFYHPLTIVEAPMGYGKTTSVREHLNKVGVNVLWQRVYDSSTSSFWNGFGRLFRELDDKRSQSLLQLGFPDDGIFVQEALNLIEDIKLTVKTVLVIDDYHLIDSPKINSLIELLVENEIDNLHIVIIARFTGLQNLEELALKGYLHHITEEIFELNPKGIVKYYKLCGISLNKIEADKLYSLSEGWITALYLLMLNFIEDGSFSTIANIYKLIEKAVYTPYSEETKDFLLTMCIFDSFTLEQAFHMWQKENAGKLLTEISNKNAFVKYDARKRTYHIHSIFLNFLKEVLESRNIKLDLYRRAAHWSLKTGDYRLAMHYFYLNNDFDQLYLAFEKEKATNKNIENNKELLIKYLVECPDEVKAKHHLAVLIMAFRLYSYNEIDLFRKTCGEFMRNIQTDESINDDQRNHFLGEFEMLMSFTGYNDILKMAEHHKKASRLLKEPSSFIRSNSIWTFGSPSIIYMFYRETGKLEEHIQGVTEDMPRYSQMTNGNATGAGDIVKAEWHFNRGDFENAEILLHQALRKARSKKQMANIICALFLETRIAMIKGNLTMLEILENMHGEITEAGEYLLIHTKEICEGYLYSLLQQSDKLPKWLRTGDFSSNRLLFPIYPMLNIVYGRALLITGEHLKLIGNSESFLGVASVFPNLLGQIYTYIYLAAANNRILRQKEALVALKQSLDIALPDKVYMPFVENCDYILPLLEELKRQGIYRQDIAKILELYKPYQKAVGLITNEYFPERKPALADREIEIAQLAAEGFSNKEIGERLFISQNTVKTQLKRIFEKLEINSRVLLKQHFNHSQQKSPTSISGS